MNDITPYLENIKLLSTIGGLLAGFTLAVVFQLIKGDERTQLTTLTLIVFLSALGCFVVSVFNSTFMVIGSNTFAFVKGQASSREDLPFAFHLAVTISMGSFIVGLLLFTGGIGCSGWLYSRPLGLLSTAIAGVTIVATFGVLMLMSMNF